MSRHILPKTRLSFFFACGEADLPTEKRLIFVLRLRRKKGAAHKKRGAASRTTPTARGGKNGIYGENVCERNISPAFLRPGMM